MAWHGLASPQFPADGEVLQIHQLSGSTPTNFGRVGVEVTWA